MGTHSESLAQAIKSGGQPSNDQLHAALGEVLDTLANNSEPLVVSDTDEQTFDQSLFLTGAVVRVAHEHSGDQPKQVAIYSIMLRCLLEYVDSHSEDDATALALAELRCCAIGLMNAAYGSFRAVDTSSYEVQLFQAAMARFEALTPIALEHCCNPSVLAYLANSSRPHELSPDTSLHYAILQHFVESCPAEKLSPTTAASILALEEEFSDRGDLLSIASKCASKLPLSLLADDGWVRIDSLDGVYTTQLAMSDDGLCLAIDGSSGESIVVPVAPTLDPSEVIGFTLSLSLFGEDEPSSAALKFLDQVADGLFAHPIRLLVDSSCCTRKMCLEVASRSELRPRLLELRFWFPCDPDLWDFSHDNMLIGENMQLSPAAPNGLTLETQDDSHSSLVIEGAALDDFFSGRLNIFVWPRYEDRSESCRLGQ